MPHGPIEVIFDVAEEIGLMGAYEVDMESVKAEFAIVLDGEEMDCIVNKSPSANRMVYEVDGIAAHAGMAPENGISAIEVFAFAVSQMPLGRIDSETTANIGKVEAGTATNIVTPKLMALAEARSHSEDALQRQTECMSAAFHSAVKKFTRTIGSEQKSPVFREKVKREFKAIDVSEDSLPYRLTLESGEMLGLKMKAMAIGGGTNASVYNEKGLPSVIIGCGMKAEHTTGEHLSIADLEMSAKLCLGIIAKHQEQSKH
jgi:tripeptide aminopeptidase